MQRFRRFGMLVSLVLALLLLAGCASGSQSSSRTPTATGKSTARPNGTPSATATPAAACNGQLPAVLIPADAVPVGKTSIKGATISCAYRVALDLQTTASFFKKQMGASGWTLLKEQPQGPQSSQQEYFQGLSFATIILAQDANDAQATTISIIVETSK